MAETVDATRYVQWAYRWIVVRSRHKAATGDQSDITIAAAKPRKRCGHLPHWGKMPRYLAGGKLEEFRSLNRFVRHAGLQRSGSMRIKLLVPSTRGSLDFGTLQPCNIL
jgi:hypothetical protein